MSISLYNLSVTTYLQVLGSTSAFLLKGKEYAKSQGIELSSLLDARLADDMEPLRFQITAIAHHSVGAIKGIKAGEFNPPPTFDTLDYDSLHTVITDAIYTLENISEDQINALEGTDMRFQTGHFALPFSAEGFIHSFSLPNFFFHVTTAYNILRTKGVPLGKLDYLGAMQIKS